MFDKELIKKTRTKLKLTQKEFAKSLGTSQQMIAMIESGRRDISKSMIQPLKEIYSIDYFESKSEEHKYTLKVNFCTSNSSIRDMLKKLTDMFDKIESIEIQEVMEK